MEIGKERCGRELDEVKCHLKHLYIKRGKIPLLKYSTLLASLAKMGECGLFSGKARKQTTSSPFFERSEQKHQKRDFTPFHV